MTVVAEPELAAAVYVALGRVVRGLLQEATGSVVGPGGVVARSRVEHPQKVGQRGDGADRGA